MASSELLYQELLQKEPVFERIVQNGDALLDESEDGPEKASLMKRLEVINDQWNGIKSQAQTRKDYIEKLYPLSESYNDNYVLFSVFLEDSEKHVNGLQPSLDKSKTTEQLKDIKKIRDEVDGKEELLFKLHPPNDPIYITCKEINITKGLPQIERNLDAVDARWKKLNNNLDEKERECGDILNKLAEFAERIKPLEDIVDEVVQLSKEPAVFGIDIEKGRKIKEHIKDLKDGIVAGKPALTKLQEEIPEIVRIGGVAADPVEEQFQVLNVQLDNCEITLDELDRTVDEQIATAREFNEKCEALEQWLPEAFESPAITETISFEPDDLFRQIDDIKALTNEIDRQKDELQSCQQMSVGLIELNRNNKDGCNSITTRLHKITSSLVELENALEDKQRKFGSVRKYLDKYHQLKIPVDEYLAATDARLDELTPFGLDVETGEKHQKELEALVKALDKKKPDLRAVNRAGQSLIRQLDIYDKIEEELDELSDTYYVVTDKTKEKLSQTKEQLQKAKMFIELVVALEVWVQDAYVIIESFDHEQHECADDDVVKDKLEKLQEAQIDLKKQVPELKEAEEIRDWFNENVDEFPELCEAIEERYEAVRAPIEDELPDKFDNLENTLQDSLASSKELLDNAEELDRWLSKLERTMNEQTGISALKETNYRQVMEQNYLDDELKIHAGKMEEISHAAHDIHDDDHDHKITEKLDEQSKRWNVIVNKCSLRKRTLQKVSHLIEKLETDYEAVLPSLVDMEERFDSLDSVSVVPEKLAEQTRVIEDLVKELAHCEKKVAHIKEAEAGLGDSAEEDESEVKARVDDLGDRVDNLRRSIEGFANNVSEMSKVCDVYQLKENLVDQRCEDVNARAQKIEPSGDLATVNSDVEELEKLLSDIMECAPELDTIEKVGADMLEISPDEHNKEALKDLSVELKKKHEDTVQNIKDMIENTKQMKDNMEKFTSKIDEVAKKTAPVKEKIASLSPVGPQVKEQLIEVEELQCEAADLGNLFNEAEMYCQDVLGLDNCTPEIEKCVQEKLAACEAPINEINKELDDREGALKQQLKECGDIQEQIDDFLRRAKNIDDKVEDLSGKIPSMKSASLASAMDDLQRVCADVDEENPILEDILRNGQKMLDSMASPAEKEELTKKLDTLDKQWKDTVDKVNTEKVEKEKLKEKTGELEKLLEDVEKALDGQQHKVKALKPVSCSPEKLGEQQNEAEGLLHETEACEPVMKEIETLIEELAPVCDNACADVKQRLGKISTLCVQVENDEKDRLKEIADVQDKVEQFNSIARPLKDKLTKLEKNSGKLGLYGVDKEKSREVQDDINKQLKQVENMKQRANELNGITGEMKASEQPHKYDDFVDEDDEITQRVDELRGLLAAKGEEVESIIAEWDQLENEVGEISETVDQLESDVNASEVKSLDLDALKTNIENVGEVLNKLGAVKPTYDDLKKRGRKLQEKGVGTELVSETLPNIDDKVRSIQREVPYKVNELEKLADRLNSFNENMGVAEDALDAIEKCVEEQKPVGGDKEVIDQQMSELKELTEKLDSASSKVAHLVEACANVESKYPNADSKIIDEPLKKLSDRLSEVSENIANRQCKLEDALVQCGQFNEAIQALLAWLIETSELINNQKPTSGVDHNVLKAQLQEQKLLMRMFADRESSVNNLKKCGEELLKTTEDEPTKQQIEKDLSKVNTLWDTLKHQVDERHARIDETVVVAEKFNDNIKGVGAKLDQIDEKLKQFNLPSAQVSEVKEQIEHVNELAVECSTVEPLLAAVQLDIKNLDPYCTDDDSFAVHDKYEKLRERYEQVLDNCHGKKHNLTRAHDILEVFYDKQQKLADWLESVETDLKDVQSNEGTGESVGKVKKIQKDLIAKKPDVGQLLDLSKELKIVVKEDEYSQINEASKNVEERYKNVKAQVDETARDMIMAKEKIQMFELKLNGLKDWTNQQLNKYRSMQAIDVHADKIKEQLNEHQDFTVEIKGKDPQFEELYDLGETILMVCDEEEGPVFGDRIDNLKFNKQQLDKGATERYNLLVEALLLAQQFADLSKDIEGRLSNTEHLLNLIDEEKSRGSDIQKEKLTNIEDNIKQLQPLMDSLQRTGSDLITLSGNSENSNEIREAIDECVKRWEMLQLNSEDKGITIEAAAEQVEAVWNDLEVLMEKLQLVKEIFKSQAPIPVQEALINDELQKLTELEATLAEMDTPVHNMNNSINNILKEDPNSPFSTSLKDRQRKLGNLWKFINEACANRKNSLEESSDASRKFWSGLGTLEDTLLDVQTKMADQSDPGLEPEAIAAILSDHDKLHLELDGNESIISVLAEVTPCLVNHATQEDKIDVYKKLTNITEQWDAIEATWSKRKKELEQLKVITVEFVSEQTRVEKWLDEAEENLKTYTLIPTDLQGLKDQLRSLRSFHRDLAKHQNEITRLTQKGDVLAEKVNYEGSQIVRHILETIHKRWEDLLDKPYDTQQQLEEALLERGHLGFAIDELLVWIEQTKGSLGSEGELIKDKKFIEVEISKLKVITNDVMAHKLSVNSCQKAAENLLGDSNAPNKADLEDKLSRLNIGWEEIQQMLKDREAKLDGALEDSKNFQTEVHELLTWLSEAKVVLKSSGPYGGKVAAVTKQLDKHRDFMRVVEVRKQSYILIVETFEILIQSSDMSSARILELTLHEIKSAWEEVGSLAEKILNELLSTLKNAQTLEDFMSEIEIWIVRVEGSFSLFTNVSTLLESIKDQITEFDEIYVEVTEKRETFRSLRKTAENVVDRCVPEDAELVNKELEDLSKKWKNLNNKLKERKKVLDENYEQSKVFFEGYEQLMAFLDDIEGKINNDLSVGRDANSVKSQMRKHKEFQNELGKKQTKLNIIVKAGKTLCDKSQPEEVEVIDEKIGSLRGRWDAVCVLSVDRQHKLEEALLFHGMFQDAVQALLDWVNAVEPTMVSETAIMGDRDTVKFLVDNHKTFMRDFAKRKGNYESILKTGEAMLVEGKVENVEILIELLENLKGRWESLSHTSRTKQERLQSAFTLAIEFKTGCMSCVNNLADLEDKLKEQGPVAEDVAGINKMLEEFSEFQKRLDAEEVSVNACLKKGEVILRFCHPSSLHTVRHQVAIVKKRWTDVSGWARLRKARLDEGLQELLDEERVAQVLMEWITEMELLLEEREKVSLPEEYNLLVQLLNEHKSTLTESEKKQVDYGKITKRAKRKPLSHSQRHSTVSTRDRKMTSQREFANAVIEHLSKRWQKLWLVLLDRRRRIEERLEEIRILKASAEFNWEEWRTRYNNWLHDSKSRVLDMWRHNDSDKDNKLTREEFVHGLSDTNFPSERWEIELVFDKLKRGILITYTDFMDGLKGRKRKADKPKTESEEIHDIIGSEVAKCCCAHKFLMLKVDEGKYRFGETQKLRLVRILRSMVMVRVGGGWESLIEFLTKNDPCRAAGATNYELRENFIMPDHASQSMQAFKPKSGGSRPSLSREGSGSGIPVPNYKMKRERSGLNRSRDELDGHSHSHLHAPGMSRKKSDLERDAKQIPHYKRETYKGRSSGYGVTHSVPRKKKESTLESTPPTTKGTTPKTDSDRTGDVYSRLYGKPKTKTDSTTTPKSKSDSLKSANGATPKTTKTTKTDTPKSGSKLETPKSRTASVASKTKTDKDAKPSGIAKPSSATSSMSASASAEGTKPRGGVFERLAAQGTATRRASSAKDAGKKASTATKRSAPK